MTIEIKATVQSFVYLGPEDFDLIAFLQSDIPNMPGAKFWEKIVKVEYASPSGTKTWLQLLANKFDDITKRQQVTKLVNNGVYKIFCEDFNILPYVLYDGPETGLIVTNTIDKQVVRKVLKVDQPVAIGPHTQDYLNNNLAQQYMSGTSTLISKIVHEKPGGGSSLWASGVFDKAVAKAGGNVQAGGLHGRQGLKEIQDLQIHTVIVDPELIGIEIGVNYTDYDADGIRAGVDLDDNDAAVGTGRPPTITLLGDNPLLVTAGDTFVDPGVEYSDTESATEDLVLTTKGDPDTGVVGDYEIEYTVTDPDQQSASVTREVKVLDATYTFDLLGDNHIKLDIRTTYVEPGYTATKNGVDVSDKVSVDVSNLNVNVAGEWSVRYTLNTTANADGGFNMIERVRTILIEDATTLIGKGVGGIVDRNGVSLDAPTNVTMIFNNETLTGDPREMMFVDMHKDLNGDSVIDETDEIGVSYDPVFEGKTFTIIHDGTTYEFTFQKNQFVSQDANIPPVITLQGGDMTIATSDTFVDPGATATDIEDGALSVTIDGQVDDSTPGEYIIKYSVTDSAGATVEKQRTVTVIQDTDGDGEPDDTDPDIDGDNIPNEADADPTTAHDPDNPVPTADDTDGDGVKNEADADPETPFDPNNPTPTTDDADGDGVKNEFDDDVDGDGTTNDQDDDVDGDGISNEQDADPDTPVDPDNPVKTADDVDGDGTKNEFDDDIDGDGDTNDVDTDDDGDGIDDIADADHPDNTGKPDSDGDGVTDEYDTDATGDDIDNDGIPNDQDTDHGAAGKSDLDGDSWADEFDDDIDGDGVANDQDTVTRVIDTDKDHSPTGDIDGDGVENQNDTDDDGDGVDDVADADHPDNQNEPDHDGDGIIDKADASHPDNIDEKNSDSGSENSDDVIDSYDSDQDGDGTPNDQDPDMDGDGVANEKDIDTPGNENKGDIDGDNIIDEADPDMDGDGKMNDVDEDVDGDDVLNEYDGDSNPDIVDTNNDNIDDRVQTEFNPDVPDIDGDGITPLGDANDDGDDMDDQEDPNDDNDNVPDLYDMDHPDNQDNPDAKDDDGDGVRDDAPADVIDNANNDDIDGDGISNNEDDDVDGDNVLNKFDGDYNPNITDTNNNNIDDSIEKALNPAGTDSDGDGILDHGDSDMDGDGVESQLDGDDDGDTIPDAQDASHPDNADKKNSDNDDIIDEFDTDDDNDDIPDTQDDDIDGDGVKNELDADHTDKPDTDNDGVIDEAQPQFNPDANDTDGDNIIDAFDDDIDGDGVDNVDDDDIDGDGVTNEQDADPTAPVDPQNPVKTADDVDGDGTKNEFDDDIDGDGFPNDMDDDDDGDGTPDIADGDHPDNADKPDVDDDGIVDEYDTDVGNDGTVDPGKSDSDGDGVDDTVDNDDDNDGLADDVDRDADGDGIDDFYQTDDPALDANGDGLKDSYQDIVNADTKKQQDADGDGIQDYFDNDDDNDGVPDQLDNDDDGDGIDDIFDADHRDNFDPDLANDPLAGDQNNDGVVDKYDASNTGETDTDGDGLPDIYDSDDDNDGTPDIYDTDDDGDGIDDVDEVEVPAETAFVKFKMIDNDTGAYTNDISTIVDPNGEATSLGNGWYEVPSGPGKIAIFESTMFKSAEWEDMENPGVLDTFIYSNEADAENYNNWISNEPLSRSFVSPPGSYQYYVDTNNEYIRYVINVQSFATSNWWVLESFLVMKNQAPTIDAVLGDDPLLVNQYSTSWNDPGVTVSDPNMNDSPSVSVSHNIDFTVPGDYTVTYTADDGRGGVSSPAYRVVRIVPSAAPPPNYTLNVRTNDFTHGGSIVANGNFLTTGGWSNHPTLARTKTSIISTSSGTTLGTTAYQDANGLVSGGWMKFYGWHVTSSAGNTIFIHAENNTDYNLTNKGPIKTGQTSTLNWTYTSGTVNTVSWDLDWTGQTVTIEPELRPASNWWYMRSDNGTAFHRVLVEFPGVTDQHLDYSLSPEPLPTAYTDNVDSVPGGEIIRFKKAWYGGTFKDGTTNWQGAGNIKVFGWKYGRWVDLIGENKITPTWTNESVEWVWTEFPIQHVYIWQNI